MFALPLNKRVKYLSRGMKSQLALCLALGNDPDLLILDEPTTGLDPVARELFLTTLVREVAAAGKTIFFSSHILSEIEAIADHVAVLHHGVIVLNDELDQLRERQKVLRRKAEHFCLFSTIPSIYVLLACLRLVAYPVGCPTRHLIYQENIARMRDG